MKKLSMWALCSWLGCVACAFGGAKDVTLSAVVAEGDVIARHGTVTGVNDISVNNAGQWLVDASITPLAGVTANALLIRNGEVYAAEDQAVEPAPSTISSFSNLLKSMNNDGDTAFRLSLAGGPAANGMYFNLEPFVLVNEVAAAPQFTAGTPYTGFFRARVDDSDRIFLIASVDDSAIPTTVDRALVWFDPDGKGGWAQDCIAKEGDALPGMTGGEAVGDFGTNHYSFSIDDNGNALYTVAIAGGLVDTNGALYYNDVPLVRKGDESPISGSAYSNIGSDTRCDLNNKGDYVFRSNLTNAAAGANIVIVRNNVFTDSLDELVVRLGDEAPGIDGVTVTGFGTGPTMRINDRGDITWFAVLSGDAAQNQALFVNNTPVLRKGVTTVDGMTITTIGGTTATGGITKAFVTSDDGRYILVRCVLDGGTQSAVLIDLGEQVSCPVLADLDCNGVVDGIDLGILLSQWFAPGSADFDGDDDVDGVDLGILLNNWTL